MHHIAALLYGASNRWPADEEEQKLRAVALVHYRSVHDLPSRCLPAPPLRTSDVPVDLSQAEATDSHVAYLSGYLMDALMLMAFGRVAAFAAAPERAALLHRRRSEPRGSLGPSALRRQLSGDALRGPPLSLAGWEDALEGGFRERSAQVGFPIFSDGPKSESVEEFREVQDSVCMKIQISYSCARVHEQSDGG